MAFFFFQAEDGIRDIGVTGVQTCALPISEYARTCARGCGGGGVVNRMRTLGARPLRRPAHARLPAADRRGDGRAGGWGRGKIVGGGRFIKKKKKYITRKYTKH